MSYRIPRDARSIRQRIRSYERKLEKERQEYGRYRDGYGKRHLLGPLYMVMGELEGALRHFRWYEREFPDESGEPAQCLCWALALYRGGDKKAAARKLKQTMLMNLYIIPYLIGDRVVELDIRHSSSDEWPMVLNWTPEEYFDLWTEEELGWARERYFSAEFVQEREEFISERATREGPKGSEELAEAREMFGLEKPPERRRGVG